jgi:hypothetical protein
MPLAPQRWHAHSPPAANVGMALLIDGYVRTAYVADRSVSVRVARQGNSLGTMDATLIDPAVMPTSDQLVRVFAGTLELFEGWIRSLEVDEYRGGHTFVGIGATDAGADTTLPIGAPFGLSDTPNGSTTFGYRSLRRLTRTTEGGPAKTSYEVVFPGYGLWLNMLVNVTSVVHGLTAQPFTTVDASIHWEAPAAPVVTLELDTALVRLSELVKAPQLSPGAITGTAISDGAISTPKLAADAVIANVANVGNTVLINSNGITVTGGAIIVQGADGTVIIDGSNMFKIAATGTLTAPSGAGLQSITVDVTTNMGASQTPIFIAHQINTGTFFAQALPLTETNGLNPASINAYHDMNTRAQTPTQTRVTANKNSFIGVLGAYTYRYYLLKEAAI